MASPTVFREARAPGGVGVQGAEAWVLGADRADIGRQALRHALPGALVGVGGQAVELAGHGIGGEASRADGSRRKGCRSDRSSVTTNRHESGTDPSCRG
jgi:hypothetical protein